MIDTKCETLINFADAAARLPRAASGKSVSPKTIARWALHGFNGVRLESVPIGKRLVTSVEACQRFFVAITQHEGKQETRLPSNAEVKSRLAAYGYK